MTDERIKEEVDKNANESASSDCLTFAKLYEQDGMIKVISAGSFYAGFRAAERLAKIEVLKELLVDLESCGHGCIDILTGKLEKLEIN